MKVIKTTTYEFDKEELLEKLEIKGKFDIIFSSGNKVIIRTE